MTWTLKILADRFSEREVIINNGSFEKQAPIIKDFVINHHRDKLSTWREVEYELNKRKESINKQDISETFIMTTNSSPIQFLNPTTNEVDLILPANPKEHTRYLIKNVNLQGRIINIKLNRNSAPLVILRNPDNVVKLYFDSVQYQLEI